MQRFRFFFFIILLFTIKSYSQNDVSDKKLGTGQGIENIIFEKYYENTNTVGNNDDIIVPIGATTYRVYIDMAPGYRFQALFAFEGHKLYFKTTNTFFNDTIDGAKIGKIINPDKLHKKSVALDSWLTVGSATSAHLGVLKQDDTNTSILNIPSLDKEDGLIAGTTPDIQLYKIDLLPFKHSGFSEYVVSDGVLAVKEGMKGFNNENYVLVAQLTTTGKISFGINVQLLTPDKRVEQYVYENPTAEQFELKKLKYN